MDADAQPGVIVARTAGEEAADAAAERGGFRTPPERPDPTADSLARALAQGEADGAVRLDERDVTADLGAIDPAAVPSVQRPDGAPGFTEQYAGASLVTELTIHPEAPVQTAQLRTPPARRNPTSGRILTEADRIIHGERAEAYGPAEISFDRIARLWAAYLDIEVDAYDVAMLMTLMKVSRAKTDVKDDTAIDIAGYAALSMRCAEYAGRAIREEHRG